MKPFEGLSLEKWEQRKLLKEASKMYFLGERVAIIFDEFQSALYYLHFADFTIGYGFIKRGFNHEE